MRACLLEACVPNTPTRGRNDTNARLDETECHAADGPHGKAICYGELIHLRDDAFDTRFEDEDSE